VVSVLLALGVLFFGTVLSLAVRWLSFETWKNVTLLLLVALWPVFQYAWTFFYLRLIELEEPRIQGVGPFLASSALGGPWHVPGPGQPPLKLVEPPSPDPEESEGGTA